MPKELLFSITNHHIEGCGKAPTVDGDTPSHYYGYFKNEYGEQWIFDYDIVTDNAVIFGGDVGWDERFKVDLDKGLVPNLILNFPEKIWVASCIEAIKPIRTNKHGKAVTA